MKVLLSLTTAFIILALSFTTQTFVSCTKEVHDTTIVQVHDTTILYYHDTIQLTMESCCNPDEGFVNSYVPTGNGNGEQHLLMSAWTHGGSPENQRSFTRFKYSDIPANATIVSAKLSLYHMINPLAGNFTTAHSGTANAFYIRRITSTLTTATANWNNPPSVSTQNQVLVPQAVSDTQDEIDLDVTNLVKDMIANGNNGFFMQLQTENPYNIRQYCSSFNDDASRRPKLVIRYKLH